MGTDPLYAVGQTEGLEVMERRGATILSTTDAIPQGTLVTVPSAPTSGTTGTAPVVAVDNKSRWTDPLFLLTFITSLGSTIAAIVDVLPVSGPISWRATIPKIMFAIINGVAAFLRTQINSVMK